LLSNFAVLRFLQKTDIKGFSVQVSGVRLESSASSLLTPDTSKFARLAFCTKTRGASPLLRTKLDLFTVFAIF